MNNLLQDMRYGARMLLKNPGFTIVAVIALTLGIGATTAIFSVVNAVLLRPLPYKEPERIVWIWGQFSQGNRASTSPPDFLDYRARNQSFEEFAAMRFSAFNLTGDAEPERINGAIVTTNFFQTLGVQPIQGRVFLTEEEQAGREQVAIISDGLWQRKFGSDPKIIGKKITLDGKSYDLVGIVPDRSRFPQDAELWTPLTFDHPDMKVRRFHFLRPIARLKPGVTIEQAKADTDAISMQLEKQYPDSNTTWRLRLVPLPDQIIGETRRPLYILLGAVVLVLLIACVNVANLLLARAAARGKELAIRNALGAGRLRLIRQMLTESLLLSLLGGGAGLLLAVWGTEFLVNWAPDDIPRLNDIGIDSRVLGFTLLTSLLTGLIFGIAPALHASAPDLHNSLKEGGKSAVSGRGLNRSRNLLVVTEVALSLLLLIGAGLLIQSFRRLQEVDLGFNPNNLLTMRISLPESKYSEREQRLIFFEQVLQRLNNLPGVQAAGLTTHLPLRGGGDTYFTIEGKPFPDSTRNVTAINPQVSHNYLRVMNTGLIKGRHFTEQETRVTPNVVIINDAFARTYFQNEEPLGRRLIIDVGVTLTCEIIGVARDAKQYTLEEIANPTMYIPSISMGWTSVVVRTVGDPLLMEPAVRKAVLSVDKDQPIALVRSMEQIISTSIAQARFRTFLLGLFAAVALILAGVGIYGVINYSVAQRTREIGLRMALGAQKGTLLRMIIGGGLKLTLIGVAIGLVSALALTTLISSLLFEVNATDPATYLVVAILLIGVALLACYLPARKATKVDPMTALRTE